jgi:hypothetical protein
MAKQICRICQTEFDYCNSCAITKNPFKNKGYCNEECYRISMIMQKYGCSVITANDAILELQQHNIDHIKLQTSTEAYYNRIKSEAVQKEIQSSNEEEYTSSFNLKIDKDIETTL